MDIQLAIFLKFNSLKRGQNQEILSLEEGSSLQPLRQGISLKAQLQKNGKKLGRNQGAIFE